MENDHTGIKPTCKEVHRLTSEGFDRDLSLVERARMRLHLFVCDACRNFTGQMALLRRAMRQLSNGGKSGADSDPK
jgi:predicted anti-sigma-YlaC factor YlaD